MEQIRKEIDQVQQRLYSNLMEHQEDPEAWEELKKDLTEMRNRNLEFLKALRFLSRIPGFPKEVAISDIYVVEGSLAYLGTVIAVTNIFIKN